MSSYERLAGTHATIRLARETGEFGSRDHWPSANTILMAGAGVPGGAVYGRTDATGSEVIEHPVSPADITATILHALGVDPRTRIHEPGGRPYPLSEGTPIRALVT